MLNLPPPDDVDERHSQLDDNIIDEFNLKIEPIDIVKNEPKNSYTKDEIKKANEIATIFLDTRKVLKSDHNIVDPVASDHDHLHHKSILRSSLVRAEKVKTMMAIKYVHLQRQYDWYQSQHSQNIIQGLDGVYNPLQIIRNRKLRSQYHEYPKPMNIKTLPLACNVFSKYAKTKKNYKMLWSVELNELLQDKTWRSNHIHELVNSKNQLWVPNPSDSKSHHKKSHRIKSKLLDREKYNNTNHSSSLSNQSDPLISSKLSKLSKHKSRRHKITNKVKRHSKKLYSSNSSSNIEDSVSMIDTNSVGDKGNREHDSTSVKSNPLKNQFFKPVSIKDHEVSDEHIQSHDITIPQIKIESIENINNVSINSITKSPEDSPEISENESIEEQKCRNILAGQDLELNEIFKTFSFISEHFNLKRNFLINIYPIYTQKVNDKLDNILNNQVREIMNSIVRVNDHYLQIFETLYISFSDEIQAVIHLTNDVHSVKIDNLLSTSDRSIGELNTSLTSEVRKVDERIDRLKESFVESRIIEGSKDATKYKMRLNEGNYKTFYYILESMIVIFLRFVWVIANIYKVIASVLRFLWKIIKIFLC